jgi:large subunit ribosomal protein L18
MKMTKQEARMRRKKRIRKKINGTAERPRLVVYRSNSGIYGQIIDDLTGSTLISCSSQTLGKAEGALKLNKATSEKIGKEIARLAKENNIEKVVFDRNGYLYHGRIKAFAEGAREGGLLF